MLKQSRNFSIFLLCAFCAVLMFPLQGCDSGSVEAKSTQQSGVENMTAEKYLAQVEENKKKKVQSSLDFDMPVVTTQGALVCRQSVLIAAAYDRRVSGGLDTIYDTFTAIWNRSEKIKKLGCEEWREGIPVFFAHRMTAPFDDFVGFATVPSGMAEYFTMAPHLKNKLMPKVTVQPSIAESPTMRPAVLQQEEVLAPSGEPKLAKDNMNDLLQTTELEQSPSIPEAASTSRPMVHP